MHEYMEVQDLEYMGYRSNYHGIHATMLILKKIITAFTGQEKGKGNLPQMAILEAESLTDSKQIQYREKKGGTTT
jgi:hypothetical protein